jgi:hypothetical protein
LPLPFARTLHMELEVETGRVVPEPYADNRIFGWEESFDINLKIADNIQYYNTILYSYKYADNISIK